ncbi:hypothetical protein SK854_05860 [Lentzea sp. BCCO 10_0061]|uniref:Uncharacterized protein n=1 Tax=Lentzea sokolovensis TaxID=3095429 RepID=A0ABU4UQ61_9PSEU|nr:hypothetical protein [Lentzea sp. BCCO 10_0061]MDX8141628.1 hypothetical protein [Lentzea sp. BCCO 10_0061]
MWSKPPPIELVNVRLLAGYCQGWLFDPDVAPELREANVDGLPLVR